MKRTPPKPKLLAIQFLILTCLLWTASSVFGQSVFIWTNNAGGPLDIAAAVNWSPNGTPNPIDPNSTTAGAGDVMEWNGQTVGPVTPVCISADGAQGGASGANTGLKVYVSSNQTSVVEIYTTNATSPNIRCSDFTNDASGGGLILGDNTANTLSVVLGGVQGQIHNFQNGSVNPCFINPNVKIQYGGGGAHTLLFEGPGNWYCSNSLNNANGSSTVLTLAGPGTLYYYATNTPNAAPNATLGNPVTISGGDFVILNSTAFSSTLLGSRNIANNAMIEYNDAAGPAGSGTLSGNIPGTGAVRVDNGTLTLSGQNSYSGSNILAGGELIAGSPENFGNFGPLGNGGTISFFGGTLGHSANNGFDYSARFDTAASQAYRIDTGGAFVQYATPLGSTGGSLTKLGGGALTLAGGASYSGPTTVSGGKLTFQGIMSGTGNITVADGAELSVFNTGTQVSPGTLTLGSSGGSILDFSVVNSTTTAPLKAGTLVSAGTQVININSGTFVVGQNYPLLAWTSGSAPAVQLGLLNGFIGNLFTNGNSIELNIVATAFSWTGGADAFWNLSSVDWLQNGSPVMITNNAPAILDDTTTVTNVAMATLASPTVATFNNNTNPYAVASSGGNNLGGNAGLFVAGSGTVTLSGGANTYSGVTTLGGGTTIVSTVGNGGTLSDIGAAPSVASNIVFNGGALQYIGAGSTNNRLFTLNSFGGTIDNESTGVLNLNNPGVIGQNGGGPRLLTLTGINTAGDIFASALRDGSGATSLSKQGVGTWILTGTNSYSGVTTIANGVLQVGNGGTGNLGNSSVINNTGLVFSNSASSTVVGAINGPGAVTNAGTGTAILANNNGFTGGLYINSGTVQVGNGGPTGSLNNAGAMVDNGTLIFNSTGSFFYLGAGIITGTGNVIAAAGATRPIDANTYTGWTQINAGATFQPCQGNTGALASSAVTNNGTLLLVRQDTGIFIYPGPIVGTGVLIKDINNVNPGDVTLTGTNNYTGGTFINGGSLIVGDGNVSGSISSSNNIFFTNSIVGGADTRRSLVFNRADNITYTCKILGAPTTGAAGNLGLVAQLGSGVLTLSGANTYTGGTSVSNGTLVAFNSIGTGPVEDDTMLILSNAVTVSPLGNMSGAGTFVMGGSGLTTLGGANGAFSGTMIASNGTLGVVSSAGGTVDVNGGTLAPGGFKTVGVMSIGNSTVSPAVAGSLNINSGTVSLSLNKALAQSNSLVQMTVTNTLTTFVTNNDTSITTNVTVTSATGTITYVGGTVQLINVGPTLVSGDRFVLFSQPISGGDAIPITTLGGFTVINHIGDDGSVTVSTVAQPPAPSFLKKPTLLNGTNLVISATNNFGPGGSWDLLATNVLHSSLANWPVILSGHFDGNGSLTLTNPIGTNVDQFFDLRAP